MSSINFIKKIIPATIKKTYSNYHTKYLLTHPKYAIGYYLKNNTGIKNDSIVNPRTIADSSTAIIT